MSEEQVNHPAHYGGDGPYEVIKVLEHWLTPEEMIGFCRGNAIKYMARACKKPGSPGKRDFAKAEWYAHCLSKLSIPETKQPGKVERHLNQWGKLEKGPLLPYERLLAAAKALWAAWKKDDIVVRGNNNAATSVIGEFLDVLREFPE